MFEGLIYPLLEESASQVKRRRFTRKTVDVADLTMEQQVRRWRPRDLPLKSLLHMVNQLHTKVDVLTYFPADYGEEIESWLYRKGVSVQVYCYENLEALRDDIKFDREISVVYTPYEEDAAWIGPRATVMSAEGVWGF